MALAISTFGVLTKSDIEELPGEASLTGTQEVSEEEEIPQEKKQTQEQIQKSITQTEPTLSQKTKPITKLVIKPKKEEPVVPKVSINTYITSGPREGEIINETNKVVFEFGSKVSPAEIEGRITYETKVEEFDENWKKTSSEERTINLPPGPKKYTFLVRAKINNVIDRTPAKRTFTINTSPYFSKVKISRAQPKSSSRPSLITLSIQLGREEEINITGWNIKGKKGSFVIPGGIEKYNPYYNPVPSESIFAKRSDTIYLSGASNPLGKGINFRPNKCLGYLTIHRDFPISLSKNCPRPEKEEISHLEICCQEFIQDLGRCKIPDYSQNYIQNV